MAFAPILRHPFFAPLTRRAGSSPAPAEGNGGWSNGMPEMEEGTLPVDILATRDEVIVYAAVPGFRKEDIDIVVEKGVLAIKAAGRSPELPEGARYYRHELDWSPLSRRIALPGIVDDAEVQAQLTDGILRVRVPVPEQAKPRRVEIHGG